MSSPLIIPFRATTPTRGADRLSSLAAHWDAYDGSLDMLSGQVATFVRASGGGAMIGADGLVQTAPHSMARWEMVLNPITGRLHKGLRIDPARTNLLLRSEDFGTTWTPGGTPTRTAAALTIGDLVLDLIEDDNVAANDFYEQTVTFTGNGTKIVSVAMKKGLVSAASGDWFDVLDSTASVNRGHFTVTWSTTGVPTVTPSSGGVVIGTVALANGVYLILTQVVGVVATNVNKVRIGPADVSTQIGTVYAGGVFTANALGAKGYVQSVASQGVANAESLTWPFNLPRAGRQTWVYIALTELGGSYESTGGMGYAGIGTVDDCGLGLFAAASRKYGGFHTANPGDTSAVASTGASASFGTFVELLVTIAPLDGKPSIEVALNGLSQGVVAGSIAPTNVTEDWTGNIIRLGTFGSVTSEIVGGVVYHSLKASEGAPTLAKARGYR